MNIEERCFVLEKRIQQLSEVVEELKKDVLKITPLKYEYVVDEPNKVVILSFKNYPNTVEVYFKRCWFNRHKFLTSYEDFKTACMRAGIEQPNIFYEDVYNRICGLNIELTNIIKLYRK